MALPVPPFATSRILEPASGHDLGVAPHRKKEAARADFGGQATTVACE